MVASQAAPREGERSGWEASEWGRMREELGIQPGDPFDGLLKRLERAMRAVDAAAAEQPRRLDAAAAEAAAAARELKSAAEAMRRASAEWLSASLVGIEASKKRMEENASVLLAKAPKEFYASLRAMLRARQTLFRIGTIGGVLAGLVMAGVTGGGVGYWWAASTRGGGWEALMTFNDWDAAWKSCETSIFRDPVSGRRACALRIWAERPR